MTDLEMTALCAEAMGYKPSVTDEGVAVLKPNSHYWYGYDPLHDDAQAMALVKKLRLHVDPNGKQWSAQSEYREFISASTTYLNRAIVACVAAMQACK